MDREALELVIVSTLERHDEQVEAFDVAAVADEVSSRSATDNLQDIDPDEYWRIIERHRR
ncbi:hypothetical protein DEO23_00660 [Brachybacterium endophyticum]|uniref:Uncharacterized protein n=1 Tax=Brachybacterium endophyticum TaxID=2182385 RepID=A0A2U2RMV9_9MICO|nr:hypothetical protein [Brachybacterium endophyticum]PWH07209.1 hypothetical protein DEO23_00660 [Brachybacterium endophyticum]